MTPGGRPDLLSWQAVRLILLFLPLAIPAGVLAVAALALGCLAQAFAAAAGCLLNFWDRKPKAAPDTSWFDLRSAREGIADVHKGLCRVCLQPKLLNADDRCVECYLTKPRPPRSDDVVEISHRQHRDLPLRPGRRD